MCSLQNSQAKLRKTSEQHGTLFIEILQQLDELKVAHEDLDGSRGHSRVPPMHLFGNNGSIAP